MTCLLALALLACTGTRRVARESGESRPRLDVYLRATGASERELELVLAAVRLIGEDGSELELPLATRELRSGQARGQLPIAGGPVPVGAYRSLVISLASASLLLDGGRRSLHLLPSEEALREAAPEDPLGLALEHGRGECEIPLRNRLRWGEGLTLFLDWDVEASLVEGTGLRLVLAPTSTQPRATLGLMFVADSTTDAVLSLDRGARTIVATTRVGNGPSALAISRDRRNLFVANELDGTLSVVDLQRDLTISTIPIRLSAGTCDLTLADLARTLVAANRALDTVSFFDVQSLVRIEDVRVGRAPCRLVAAPDLGRLYVACGGSDEVSVLDVATRQVLANLAVEAQPSCVAVDRRERELYVGHRTSRNLLVFDTASLQQTASIYVGDQVTAVLADRRRDRIFVARARPSELVVVERRAAAVVQRIPIAGPVTQLVQPPEGPTVFGAAPTLGGLVAVDVVVGEAEDLVPCGQAPADVIVVD